MKIMKYRKKPVMIEAIQWNGRNYDMIAIFTNGKSSSIFNEVLESGKLCSYFYIPTLEGSMRVGVGDYIIKGVKGEFYPCKENIFLETYELMEE